MNDASYQPPAGFLTMKQVQDRLGVSKTTLVQIVRRHGLVTHRDIRDSRVKLLRLTDVTQLEGPKPEGKAAACLSQAAADHPSLMYQERAALSMYRLDANDEAR